ncbi:response regulator [Spirosoma sp. HMF4905]|uniref:Response regulator n=1 Tax=Spirosoma arboris TaxID=2682092 RepID=A0A7K1SK52_9BACT|nr:response regulator [Spirosoma arboris]MVM34124.1 response regulator [Spirosoma arboris]
MPSKFRVLVVDDDSTLLGILNQASQTSFPEAAFTQVANVSQAKTFLNTLDGYGPRLVLLDINLKAPESGLDFLSYLRLDKQNSLLPVVMLTVSEAASDVRQAYEWGANSFSVKPFSYSDWQSYLKGLRNYWFETVTLPAAVYTKK